MNNKFFYLLELRNRRNELIKLLLNSEKFDIKNRKEIENNNFFSELKGDIFIEENKIPFLMRPQSGLILVDTPYPREKVKIFTLFNSFENIDVKYFTPKLSSEIKLICGDFNCVSFRLFDGKNVIDDEDEDYDICEELSKNNVVELLDVSLEKQISGELINFEYYGNALQFINTDDKYINEILNIFENTMIFNDSNV